MNRNIILRIHFLMRVKLGEITYNLTLRGLIKKANYHYQV